MFLPLFLLLSTVHGGLKQLEQQLEQRQRVVLEQLGEVHAERHRLEQLAERHWGWPVSNARREVHLVYPYYESQERQHAAELHDVLKSHLMLDQVHAVHLLVQRGTPVPWKVLHEFDAHGKALVKVHREPVTFALMLRYAHRYLSGKFVVLANADIEFDASLAALHRISDDMQHTMVSLSRDDQCDPDDYVGSHDVWIFVPPVRNIAEVLLHTEFYCGGKWGWGCENRFMWEMGHRAGLESVNPCLSIRAKHRHKSRRNSPAMANDKRLNLNGKSSIAVPCTFEASGLY